MFGFFEKAISDLSEIVAPIGASNQLFLAIQHGRNDEALMLINSACKDFDITTNADCGYGALHVACKYNNKVMVEEITRRGVSAEFLDKKGNTPLHYACKGGSLEIVKYLLDAGASVLRQNSQNQRPYDVAESHVIRQYLLPLQFRAEAEERSSSGRGAGPNYDPYMYVSGIETQGGPVNGDAEHRAALAAAAAAAQPPPILAPPSSGTVGNSNPYAASAASLQHPSYAAYPGFSDPTQQAVPSSNAAPQFAPPPSVGQTQASTTSVASPSQPQAMVQADTVSSLGLAQPVTTATTATAAASTGAQNRLTGSAPQPSAQGSASVVSTPAVSPPSAAVHVSHSPLKPVTFAATAAPTASITEPFPNSVPPAATTTATTTEAVAPTASITEPFPNSVPPATTTTGTTTEAVAPAQTRPPAQTKPLAFTPDGFHSSSNDPVLQQRYGHFKLVKNVAPPPIFGAAPSSGGASAGGMAGIAGPPPAVTSGGPRPHTSYRMPPPPPVSLSTAPSPADAVPPTSTAPSVSTLGPQVVVGAAAPPMMAPLRATPETATSFTGPARPVVNTFSPNDEAVSLSSSSSSVM